MRSRCWRAMSPAGSSTGCSHAASNSASGNSAVADSNEVSYNNTRGIDPNWGAGGIKCVLTTNLTFRGNYVSRPMSWRSILATA